MLETLGDDAKGEGLDARYRFIPVGSVAEHASQVRHFGQPPAVTLPFKLDRKGHAGTVTSGLSGRQPTAGEAAAPKKPSEPGRG